MARLVAPCNRIATRRPTILRTYLSPARAVRNVPERTVFLAALSVRNIRLLLGQLSRGRRSLGWLGRKIEDSRRQGHNCQFRSVHTVAIFSGGVISVAVEYIGLKVGKASFFIQSKIILVPHLQYSYILSETEYLPETFPTCTFNITQTNNTTCITTALVHNKIRILVPIPT